MDSLVGLSTSVLAEKSCFTLLDAAEPEIIEFYNYPSRFLKMISEFCDRTGIVPSFHTPMPYDGPSLKRFAPTGPSHQDALDALHLMEQTVSHAAAIRARHVVVHFPSPYSTESPSLDSTLVCRFLDRATEVSQRVKVPVLLENLSSHPTFNMPEHYASILHRWPDLGFCLDIGHAHIMKPKSDIRAFIDIIGPRIQSLHVYNVKSGSSDAFEHEFPSEDQDPGMGWISVESVVRQVSRVSPSASFLIEARPGTTEMAGDAVRFVKNILKRVGRGNLLDARLD